MKISFMRMVDRLIGVPICYALSGADKLKRLVYRNRTTKKLEKILFIELSEMGSTILASEAIATAAKKYQAELFFLIFEKNRQSIELLGLIPGENIITIRDKSFFHLTLDTLKAIFRLRSLKIDTIIDMELFSRFSSIISYLSGASRISAFNRFTMEGLYRGSFQSHKVTYNPHLHMSQNFLALVSSLEEHTEPLLKKHVDRSERTIKINSPIEAKNRMIKKLNKINPDITANSQIFLINPNASDLLPIRRWPLEKYIKLSRKLLKKHKGAFIVIIGVETDKEYAQTITKALDDKRCIDFTAKTTLKELIDLFNISDMLISNDSGPPHFASLTDLKTIVLFGPEIPNLYAPLGKNVKCIYSNFACSPCVSAYNHRKTTCQDNRCLKSISVESVLKEIEESLD